MATLGDSTITNLNVLNNITGKGSGITNLNASNLSSGSIGNITYQGKLTTDFTSDHTIGGILVSDGSDGGKIVRLTNANDTLKSAFRTYIGAGTSSLALVTSGGDNGTATTAARSDHKHGSVTKDGKITDTAITANISNLVVTNTSNEIKTAAVSSVIPTVSVDATNGVTLTPVSGSASTYKYTHHTQESAQAAAVKVGNDGEGHVVIGDALKTSDLTNDSGFLTSESDTLDTVTDRGASTDNNITLSGTTDVSGGTLKVNVLQAKTSSSSTTYGPGTSGQVLKSNGTNAYWGNDDNDTQTITVGAYYKAKNAYGGYQVLVTNRDNELVPMVSGSGYTTDTTKVMNTESFNPFGTYLWTGSSDDRAIGAVCSGSTYVIYKFFDIRYAFNVSSLTANKPFYIVAQMQSDGLAKLASPYWTQTLPSSGDGLIYIYLGNATSTTAISLSPTHPIYYYKDGMIRLFTNSSHQIIDYRS